VVKHKECQSDFFPCLTGVRQGENLFPFLFSVFLNDLEDYFKTLDGVPLEKLKERFYNELHMLFELFFFIILYADDTVLMSETKEGMQQSLNIFQLYCDLWKLDVNINKQRLWFLAKRRILIIHLYYKINS
jgi:hypothetical protein